MNISELFRELGPAALLVDRCTMNEQGQVAMVIFKATDQPFTTVAEKIAWPDQTMFPLPEVELAGSMAKSDVVEAEGFTGNVDGDLVSDIDKILSEAGMPSVVVRDWAKRRLVELFNGQIDQSIRISSVSTAPPVETAEPD